MTTRDHLEPNVFDHMNDKGRIVDPVGVVEGLRGIGRGKPRGCRTLNLVETIRVTMLRNCPTAL